MRSKRLLSFIVLVAVLAAALLAPLAASAVSPAGGTALSVNAVRGLRLRSEPNLSAPLLLALWNGERVTAIGEPVWAQGIRWSNVQVTRWGVTTTGWAASAFLTSYPGYVEPRGNFVNGANCKVLAPAGLRLRSTPSLTGAIARIVPYGTVLRPTEAATVVADGHTWRNLFINGVALWGSTTFLDCVTPS